MAEPTTRIWDGDTTTVYTLAGNWQGGVVPLVTDHVYFPASNSNPVAGVDVDDIALGSFSVLAGYSGAMGSSTAGKPTFLEIAATTVNFAGTGQTFLDVDTCTTMNVTAATSGSAGLYGLNLAAGAGAAAITTLNINLLSGQTVGIANIAGTTATVTNINISGAGTVMLGSGLTTTTINVSGTGTVTIKCAYTTLTISGTARVYHEGSGAATTVNARESSHYYWNTTGTITTLNQEGAAEVNWASGLQARAVTTWNRRGTGIVKGLSSLMTEGTFNNYGSLTGIDIGEHFVMTWSTLA